MTYAELLALDDAALVAELDDLFDAAKPDYPNGTYGGPWEDFEMALAVAWPRVREIVATSARMFPSTPLARKGDITITLHTNPMHGPGDEDDRRRRGLAAVAEMLASGKPPPERA